MNEMEKQINKFLDARHDGLFDEIIPLDTLDLIEVSLREKFERVCQEDTVFAKITASPKDLMEYHFSIYPGEYGCGDCPAREHCADLEDVECKDAFVDWLNQPAEEDAE